MANQNGILAASVTESGAAGFNSPEGLKNMGKSERVLTALEGLEEDENYDETQTPQSQVPCKEFQESKSEDLFENVPALKKTFVIESKIGEGTFSNVYLAHLTEYPNEMFALKHIIPTSSPDRVEREVRCLQEMGGKNNVIGYYGTIRNCDHNVIILPYFPHDRFQDYLHDLTLSDIQDYMRNLLLALKHIHSFSIIHRDIKPGNFLHSRKTGRYNLVDFGLAMHEPDCENVWEIEKNGKYSKTSNRKNARQLSPESLSKNAQVSKKTRTSPRVGVTSHKLARHSNGATKSTRKETTKSTASNNVKFVAPTKQEKKLDGRSLMLSSNLGSGLCQTKHKTYEICTLCMKRASQSAPRAGTSGFRAPEVLLKHPQQTTAVDVWSAGIIMLCLLSGKYPFFRCADDMTAMAQIMTVFGKKRVMESTKHLGKYLVSNSLSSGYELRELCQKLRASKSNEGEENLNTKCCSSCCDKHLSENLNLQKDENKVSSPSRRTSSRGKPSVLKEGDVIDQKAGTQCYGQVVTSKDNATTLPEVEDSKKNNSKHSPSIRRKTTDDSRLQQTIEDSRLADAQNETSKSSGGKKENLRNGHSGGSKAVEHRLASDDQRSNSVSEVKSLTLKEKTKVRFLSEGNRPSSEKSEDCSRDQTGNGTFPEHLDGSRCSCDCGSCPEYVPRSAYDLLERCLDLNPETRITANDALNHPFFQKVENSSTLSQPER